MNNDTEKTVWGLDQLETILKLGITGIGLWYGLPLLRDIFEELQNR